MDVASLLEIFNLHNVSDIFLTDGKIPHARINSEIEPLAFPAVPPGEIADFRNRILKEESLEIYKNRSSADASYTTKNDRRFRINFYTTIEGDCATIRPIHSAAELDFEKLCLLEALRNLAFSRRGLILICGSTGSGKSTTLAAMINAINQSCQRHILTLEDPVEFIHENNKALISQREIIKADGFQNGIRDAMRKNPDVIVIGEMRDMETAQAAVNAALTGHLVISTVHTGNAVLAIERIINLFPGDKRTQLAMDLGSSLLCIAAQRLVPRSDVTGMIPVIEFLPSTPMVSKLISQCRFGDLEGLLREAPVPEMANFQRAAFKLLKENKISLETAWKSVDSTEELKLLLDGMRSGIDTFKKTYGQDSRKNEEIIDIGTLLYTAVRNGSSDLLLTVDSPPGIRINGAIRFLDLPKLQPEDTAGLLQGILTPSQRILFEEKREIDLALSLNLSKDENGAIINGRFRINAFHQRGSVGIVARVINSTVPPPDKLGLPPILSQLATKDQGLILVTGPTGSGKSTTLASLIDQINTSRDAHIITIEDPIEYVHKNKKSIIEQRELHADTLSFAEALKNALRQDPDVILVGEMRDIETMSAAITAAETGHLVFATVHTNNAPQTIDRIVDSFPDHQQNQIRLQLAAVLLGVVSQRLLPNKTRTGRVPAFEIMTGTAPIKALIRDGKTHLLRSSMETGYKDGMITMERALTELAAKNIVAPEEISKILV